MSVIEINQYKQNKEEIILAKIRQKIIKCYNIDKTQLTPEIMKIIQVLANFTLILEKLLKKDK